VLVIVCYTASHLRSDRLVLFTATAGHDHIPSYTTHTAHSTAAKCEAHHCSPSTGIRHECM